MDQLRRAHRPAVPPVRLLRRTRRPSACIVLMGSGAETAHETVEYLVAPRREGRRAQGAPLPAVLGRATSSRRCPRPSRPIAVLDRTKEPGAIGEPLYQDVVTALREARDDGQLAARRRAARHRRPLRAVVEGVHPGDGQGRLRRAGQGRSRSNHFTVGIVDDVTHLSLAVRRRLRHRARRRACARCSSASAPTARSGANKNSIKIIGEETDNYAQGYFVYDSKKSGAITDLAPALRPAADPLGVPDPRGQLRRLPPVRLPREVRRARATPRPARVFLLNAPYGPDAGLGPAAARGAGADHREAADAST